MTESDKWNDAWKQIEVVRNYHRPRPEDFIENIFDDMDNDLRAGLSKKQNLVCGYAMLDGNRVAIISSNRNGSKRVSGAATPEEYREVLKFMEKHKNGSALFKFIDTPGAAIGVEKNLNYGQAKVISDCIKEQFQLEAPVLNLITGEGGSGGALAIGIGDRTLMLENATYSVISPEGCFDIFKKKKKDYSRKQAAYELKLSSKHIKGFGCIDDVLIEPNGGAHIDREATFRVVKERLLEEINELSKKNVNELLADRYMKFRKMGVVREVTEKEYKELLNHRSIWRDQDRSKKITAYGFSQLLFEGFKEFKEDALLTTADPLEFPGHMAEVRNAQRKTGLVSAVLTGKGTINGRKVVIIAMDFGYIGGTLGCAEGEKIARAFEYATQDGKDVIGVWQSGGARLQEGIDALMQMAKVRAALARLEEKARYIPILYNFTYAGVLTSLGFGKGDNVIGVEGSHAGFTGARIIKSKERYNPSKPQIEDILAAQKVKTNEYIRVVNLNDLKREVTKILETKSY